MVYQRVIRLGAALLVLAMVAAACGDDQGEATTTAASTSSSAGRADGILEIGTILPETGDLAVLGPPMIGAVSMALRDINEAGGVLGQPSS